MKLRLADEPWNWSRVLARRLFVAREALPPPWTKIYRREWDDDDAGRFTRHRRKHAA